MTVSSDPLPTQLKGIPLQLQHINVTIDRPGFVFNPTNCNPMAITGTLTGAQGGTRRVLAVSGRQLRGAGVQTGVDGRGRATGEQSQRHELRREGPVGRVVGQANIAKVDLQLPKALPARLTTIQKACSRRL